MRWIWCNKCGSEYLSDDNELWLCDKCIKQIAIIYMERISMNKTEQWEQFSKLVKQHGDAHPVKNTH